MSDVPMIRATHATRVGGGGTSYIRSESDNLFEVARFVPVALGLEKELPLIVEVRRIEHDFFDVFRVWRDKRGALRVDNHADASWAKPELPGLRRP